MKQQNQYNLLTQGRFGPFFATQFLGAFNDSFLKQALLVYIVFNMGLQDETRAGVLANFSAFVFIVPFFLFSAMAGYLADQFEKARFIRWIKAAEILIVALAMPVILAGSLPMIFLVLFLMGMQSAMFGPVKYSILPDYLDHHELTGGNGVVNGGTFLAILLGTVAGSLPGSTASHGLTAGIFLIAVALAGFAFSFAIPAAHQGDHQARPRLNVRQDISLNLWSQTKTVIAFAARDRTVLLCILGISWFWFFGFLFITQLPALTRFYIHGNQQVVNFLLVVLSIGIGSGSLLCETLSGRRIEIGVVPLGALGMTVFGVTMVSGLPDPNWTSIQVDAAGFVMQPTNWSLILSLFFLGLSAGLYVVPLLAQVQHLSLPTERSRVMAANSLINAIFMSAASLIAILVLTATSLNVAELLLTIALLNAAITLFIFTRIPEFLLRFVVWGLIHIAFRVQVTGQDEVPKNGPAVLVCNHVSYIDALILMGCVDRPIRFVMYHRIYQIPVLGFLFRIARAIPVAGRKENEKMMERAFETVQNELSAGHLVCIFPEGRLSSDGDIAPFKPGVNRIVETTPVPVVPMAVSGLWDSSFSRQRGNWGFRLRTAFRRRITLKIDSCVAPSMATAADLEQTVRSMRRQNR